MLFDLFAFGVVRFERDTCALAALNFFIATFRDRKQGKTFHRDWPVKANGLTTRLLTCVRRSGDQLVE